MLVRIMSRMTIAGSRSVAGASGQLPPALHGVAWQWQPGQARQQRCRHVVAYAYGRGGDRYASIRKQRAPPSPQQQVQPVPAESPAPGSSSSSLGGHHASHAAPSSSGGSTHPALESRRWLMVQLPFELHRAVGVSFNERQAAIAALRRDQAVALTREPDNVHDANAVAVTTLAGSSLGYIPRDRTAHFMQDRCFGFVSSVGKGEESGMWGFRIAVQPTLPPVEVLSLPASLLSHASLAKQLSGQAWEHVQRETLASTYGRCEVTGSSGAVCGERWSFDDAAQVIRLAGLRPVHPDVLQLERLLLAGGPAAACREQAMKQLAAMNAWSESDAQAYVSHVAEEQERRSSEGWRLDLSLLEQQGVKLPPGLKAACIQP